MLDGNGLLMGEVHLCELQHWDVLAGSNICPRMDTMLPLGMTAHWFNLLGPVNSVIKLCQCHNKNFCEQSLLNKEKQISVFNGN